MTGQPTPKFITDRRYADPHFAMQRLSPLDC
jgi:hypothetical protein